MQGLFNLLIMKVVVELILHEFLAWLSCSVLEQARSLFAGSGRSGWFSVCLFCFYKNVQSLLSAKYILVLFLILPGSVRCC